MGVFEIISAIVLIIACVFLVVVVLMKDTKTQMSQTISGTSSDSFYQRNAGRTKEAILNKATIAAAVIFFVLAVAVNMINIISSKSRTEAAESGSSVSEYVESDISADDEASLDTNSTDGNGAADGSEAESGAAVSDGSSEAAE